MKLKDLIGQQEEDNEVQSAIVSELQEFTSSKLAEGLTQDDIEKDIKYIELMNHYSDISDTIEQRQQRIEDLDADIAQSDVEVDNYIAEIKSLNRELEGLRKEADQAQADVALAKEEQALNDLKSGLASRDKSTEELKGLRSRVQKIKSGAEVSKKVAGTEDKNERRRLLEKHRQSRKSKELSSLLFQAEKTDQSSDASSGSREKTSLPE
jgi:exonuclease VII small subunit